MADGKIELGDIPTLTLLFSAVAGGDIILPPPCKLELASVMKKLPVKVLGPISGLCYFPRCN
jgi:hypothetical protein